MPPNMGPGPAHKEPTEVTAEDTLNFLAVTKPGLLAATPDMIKAVRDHLNSQVAAGTLTREDLDGFRETAAKMGQYLD